METMPFLLSVLSFSFFLIIIMKGNPRGIKKKFKSIAELKLSREKIEKK